jgi:hypothetical protein
LGRRAARTAETMAGSGREAPARSRSVSPCRLRSAGSLPPRPAAETPGDERGLPSGLQPRRGRVLGRK